MNDSIETLCRNADLPAIAGRYVEWNTARSSARDWWACCPLHGERTPSFHLYIRGGRWAFKCHGCGAGGDALDFLEAVGMAKADAIEVLGGSRLAPGAKPQRADAVKDDAKRVQRALAIWDRTEPIAGTLGEIYLRQWRGIRGDLVEDVRYCGAVYYRPVERETPAIVSAIRDASGAINAVHSIHLAADGSKLDADPRRCWGVARGGAIRLDPPRPTVLISEGVEDAFHIRHAFASDGSAVWAAPSASFLHTVAFPPEVQRVVICGDNDDAGRAATENLKTRLLSEGRRVRVCLPPIEGADWSDILKESEAA